MRLGDAPAPQDDYNDVQPQSQRWDNMASRFTGYRVNPAPLVGSAQVGAEVKHKSDQEKQSQGRDSS